MLGVLNSIIEDLIADFHRDVLLFKDGAAVLRILYNLDQVGRTLLLFIRIRKILLYCGIRPHYFWRLFTIHRQ